MRDKVKKLIAKFKCNGHSWMHRSLISTKLMSHFWDGKKKTYIYSITGCNYESGKPAKRRLVIREYFFQEWMNFFLASSRFLKDICKYAAIFDCLLHHRFYTFLLAVVFILEIIFSSTYFLIPIHIQYIQSLVQLIFGN